MYLGNRHIEPAQGVLHLQVSNDCPILECLRYWQLGHRSCFPSHKPLLIIIAESLIFAMSNRFRMFIDDFGGFDENQSHVAGDVDFLQFQRLVLKV